MRTLKSEALKKSNDYSQVEEEFNNRGYDLIHQNFKKTPNWLKEKVSVIMPCYNVSKSLPKTLKAFEAQIYKNFEVILVDDGSNEDLEKVVRIISCSYNLRYIKNKKNRDRSYARNTALSLAEGETIIVTDPDMVPHKSYLLNLVIRQSLTKNCVFVAFKEHIEYDDPRISDKNISMGKLEPDYKRDWRWFRHFDSSIYAPNFLQLKEKSSRNVWIVKETNYFKKLGKDNVCCAWDISSLVVGHGICFKKKDAIRSGGFAEEFTGWGHDDIAFGIRMVANGFYVIPCISASAYHINHEPHSGSFEKKLKQFKINLKRYLKYVNTPLNKIKFIPKQIKLIYQEKNKFYYQGP